MPKGRVKLVIDKDEFQQLVDKLESERTFEKIGDLWKAVEETDWAKGLSPRPLTAGVAYQRAIELEITTKVKSGGKGRQKLEINKDEFQQVVNDLEDNQTFDKLGDLWKAVEETDWAKGLEPRPLTAQVAYQRANELGIVTQTKSKRKRKTAEEKSEEATTVVESKYHHVPEENLGVPNPRGMMFVTTPAGECPHRLLSSDESTVVEWAKKVVETGIERDVVYAPTSLAYFSRYFFDVLSDDFADVKQHIVDNKEEIYSRVYAA